MRTAAPAAQPGLRRTLGVFDGIAILVGITIGAGIFSTPQLIAGYFSSFSIIILWWIIAGLFVFVGGLIYAELGSRLPNTGGEYVYLYRAFGPFVGFIFGWSQLFIIRTSPAAGLAIIAADYLGYFFPLRGLAHTAVAAGIIAVLVALNYLGIRWGSFYQKLSTALKIGGIFALVILGLILMHSQENLLAAHAAPTAKLGPIGNFSAAMMLIVFSYLGWDRVGYVAGEMKNPRRVVPLSMFFGIGIIIVVYGLANLIYFRVLGLEGVRNSTIVASDMASVILGPAGAALVAALVIISTTGSTNGTTMTAPRVYYAMARDGLFFKWLDYVHPKYRTPSRAILAHGLWAMVILLARRNFENIVAGMTFAVLIFYVMTALALFRLRARGVGKAAGYRMPLYPVLPGIYLAGILALVAARAIFEWQKSLIDLAFIATGAPFAFYWTRRQRGGERSGRLAPGSPDGMKMTDAK